jgi:FMN-dependent NADH-azoreductase
MYSAGPASAMDFQEAYLKAMFGFLGITDVKFVRAERLTKGGDIRLQPIEAARALVRSAARQDNPA